MKKHPFDVTSFLFGLVLGAAAAGFLLAQQLSWDVDGRWVLPTALIILGVAGIAGAIGGLRPEDAPADRSDDESDGEPQDAAEDESSVESRTR